MRIVAHRAAPSAPAPYASADALFADAKAYLSSREALQMSESDLERELHRRGQELVRKLLQGHLDQRSPGEAVGPVEGADGVERSERRVHDRRLETIFGTVAVEPNGSGRASNASRGEVVAEALLEAERHDPERVKRWVVLVDGAETQLDLVEAGAAACGVDVTVILDIIHVVEYVWKAAHVFHREGSPELACWAWTRVRDILEGKARRVASSMRRAATVAGLSPDARKPVDTCADYLLKYAPYLHYDRYLAAGYPIATGVVEGALSASGPRPDGVDRRPLATCRRRGGAEAAGAARQRRLRCVLGLPRSARVRAEPRPTLRWRESTAGHRTAPTTFLAPPSTGQVALTMPSQNALNLSGTPTKKEAAPFCQRVSVFVGNVSGSITLAVPFRRRRIASTTSSTDVLPAPLRPSSSDSSRSRSSKLTRCL